MVCGSKKWAQIIFAIEILSNALDYLRLTLSTLFSFEPMLSCKMSNQVLANAKNSTKYDYDAFYWVSFESVVVASDHDLPSSTNRVSLQLTG